MPSSRAGGLVFCSGTRDNKIRAFDKTTGEELWAAILPWAGSAAPATYQIEGRQYVVVPATGVLHSGTPRGDAWVAFALKIFVEGLIDWAEVSPPGISGIPERVRLLEGFINYAQKKEGILFMRKDEIARSLVLSTGLEHSGGDEGTHEAGHGGFGLHERLGLGGFVVLLVFFHHLDRAHEVIGGRF